MRCGKITVGRPFLVCGLLLCAASIFGGLYGLKGATVVSVLGGVLSLAVFKQKRIVCLCLFMLSIYLLNFVVLSNKISKIKLFSDNSVSLVLMATDSPKINGAYTEITVKSCDNGKFPASQKFTLFTYDSLPVKMGDIFTARVKLISLDNSEDRLSSYSKGICFKMKLIKFGEKQDENKFYKLLGDIRVTLQDRLFSNLSYNSAATVCAVTYGDKSFLADDFEANVRNSGVSHIMVVSGMHLSIIIGAVFKLIGKLFCNRYARFITAAVFVFMLCGVCGFTVSVTRAAIMYFIAAAAPMFYKENDSVNSLFVAVSLILLATPFAVFSASFQLSVLATLAIIGPSNSYCEALFLRFDNLKPMLCALIRLVLNTLFAMLFTMPITIFTFGEASLISPITNLAISYAVTFLLEITLASVLLSFIPFITVVFSFLFKVSDFVAGYINYTIDFFGKINNATVKTPEWVALPVAAVAFAAVIAIKYFKVNNRVQA